MKAGCLDADWRASGGDDAGQPWYFAEWWTTLTGVANYSTPEIRTATKWGRSNRGAQQQRGREISAPEACRGRSRVSVAVLGALARVLVLLQVVLMRVARRCGRASLRMRCSVPVYRRRLSSCLWNNCLCGGLVGWGSYARYAAGQIAKGLGVLVGARRRSRSQVAVGRGGGCVGDGGE